MVRFVEMKGIHADDQKSFGFYDTVNNSFLNFNGTVIFDSVYDFRLFYDCRCNVEYDRLDNLIPDKWRGKPNPPIYS